MARADGTAGRGTLPRRSHRLLGSDMRTAHKLGIAFAAPIVLMTVATAISWSMLKVVDREQAQLTEVRVPTAFGAEAFNAALYEANADLKLIAAADTPEQRRQAEADLRESWDEAAAAIDTLEAVKTQWTVQATRDRYAKSRELAQTIKTEYDRVLAAPEDQRPDLAEQVDQRTASQIKEARTMLTQIVATQREVMKEDVASIDQAQARVNTTLIACTAASALVAAVVGVFVTRGITKSVRTLMDRSNLIARGDLSEPLLPVSGNDEFSQLTDAVNQMSTSLRNLVAEAIQSATEVAAAATEVAAASEEMTQGLSQQSGQIRDVNSAVEALSESSHSIASETQSAAVSARETESAGDQGARSVRAAIEQMNQIRESVSGTADAIESLGKRSESIGEVVAIINDIADQTNLLALNAAIEAARAGEHGRGFAVVADEVRKLADRTTKATAEIGQSIQAIRGESTSAIDRVKAGAASVQDGVERTNAVQTELQQIVERARGLSAMVGRISESVAGTNTSFERIARSCQEISQIGAQSASASEQSAAAAAQLSQKAESLQRIVSRFQLERRHKDAGPPNGTERRRRGTARGSQKIAAPAHA
jgi:methyl-accepting chemotaxis protein